MVNYYDELEIEDFAWDPVAKLYHYPCPCGDRFEISKSQLRDGEEIAICPSCSLIVRVIYDYLDWEDYASSDEEDEEARSVSEQDGSPITSPSLSPTPASNDKNDGDLPSRHSRDDTSRDQAQPMSSPANIDAALANLRLEPDKEDGKDDDT